MKKLIYIFVLFFYSITSFAQEEQPSAGKLRDKMTEYVQTKLGLDKAEIEKFQPVFYAYLKDRRQTTKQYRDDRILLQQKTAEVRLRYREQFKPIIGEKRSNDVFKYEREFIEQAVDVLRERRSNKKNSRL